jgi:hypothetical protein
VDGITEWDLKMAASIERADSRHTRSLASCSTSKRHASTAPWEVLLAIQRSAVGCVELRTG